MTKPNFNSASQSCTSSCLHHSLCYAAFSLPIPTWDKTPAPQNKLEKKTPYRGAPHPGHSSLRIALRHYFGFRYLGILSLSHFPHPPPTTGAAVFGQPTRLSSKRSVNTAPATSWLAGSSRCLRHYSGARNVSRSFKEYHRVPRRVLTWLFST